MRNYQAKRIDCGLAKFVADDSSQIATSVATSSFTGAIGTPGYRCPVYESKHHHSKFEAACDIFSLGVTMAELITGYLTRQPLESPSAQARNGGHKGRDLYDFFIRQPDDENDGGPANMMDHLDPCAGRINKEITNHLVRICKKSMKQNPQMRPDLTVIIEGLQKLRRKEQKYSVDDLLQDNEEDEEGTSCAHCFKKDKKCFKCSNSEVKHQICRACIWDLAMGKAGESPDIACPISSCQMPFCDEHVLAALGSTKYKEHIHNRVSFRRWQDALVDVFHTTAASSVGGVSNRDVFELLKQQEELLLSVKVSTQERMCEIREIVVNQLRKLKMLDNNIERSQAVLSLLATGDTIPCPKLLWMRPAEDTNAPSLSSFLKRPFKRRWKIFFICEETHRLANPESPLELELDRQWLRNLAPLLKASMVALKIAGVVTDGNPLMPLLSSSHRESVMSEYDEMLHEVMSDSDLDAFSDTSVEELGVYEEIEKLTDCDKIEVTDDKAAHMKCLTGHAYRWFSELALRPEHRKQWEPYMKWEVVRGKVVWVATRECRKRPAAVLEENTPIVIA